jgi:hypothetical protein
VTERLIRWLTKFLNRLVDSEWVVLVLIGLAFTIPFVGIIIILSIPPELWLLRLAIALILVAGPPGAVVGYKGWGRIRGRVDKTF